MQSSTPNLDETVNPHRLQHAVWIVTLSAIGVLAAFIEMSSLLHLLHFFRSLCLNPMHAVPVASTWWHPSISRQSMHLNSPMETS